MAEQQLCVEASPPVEVNHLVIDRFELAAPRSDSSWSGSSDSVSSLGSTPGMDGAWRNFVDNTRDAWAKLFDNATQEAEDGPVPSNVAKGNEALESGVNEVVEVAVEKGADEVPAVDAKIKHTAVMTNSTALLLRARKEKAQADAAKKSQIETNPASEEESTPTEPPAYPPSPQIVEAAYTTWVAPISVAPTTGDMPVAYNKKIAPPSASKAVPLSKVAAPKKIEEPGTSAPGCFRFIVPRKIK